MIRDHPLLILSNNSKSDLNKRTERQKVEDQFPLRLSQRSSTLLRLIRSRESLSAINKVPINTISIESLREILFLRIIKPFYVHHRKVLFDEGSICFYVNKIPKNQIINGKKIDSISSIFSITTHSSYQQISDSLDYFIGFYLEDTKEKTIILPGINIYSEFHKYENLSNEELISHLLEKDKLISRLRTKNMKLGSEMKRIESQMCLMQSEKLKNLKDTSEELSFMDIFNSEKPVKEVNSLQSTAITTKRIKSTQMGQIDKIIVSGEEVYQSP